MHERGFWHRDIKPDNIFLHREIINGKPRDNWVLADFGLAVYRKEVDRVATICGSPDYLAPEYHPGLDVTITDWRSADVYGLGRTLMAVGIGNHFMGAFSAPPEAAYTMLANRGFTFGLVSFLRGMLAADPKKRFTIEQGWNHPWVVQQTKIHLALT